MTTNKTTIAKLAFSLGMLALPLTAPAQTSATPASETRSTTDRVDTTTNRDEHHDYGWIGLLGLLGLTGLMRKNHDHTVVDRTSHTTGADVRR